MRRPEGLEVDPRDEPRPGVVDSLFVEAVTSEDFWSLIGGATLLLGVLARRLLGS